MLYTIPFESFNLFMAKSSYYNFLLRNAMECIKCWNWIQFFYRRKTCFPLCNYMFIISIWWKKKSCENLKVLNFKKKDYKGNDSYIK
jgi:hypothetical protein